MEAINFSGSIPAVPTPFDRGEVDCIAFRGLVELATLANSGGVVVAGSTGEGASLELSEYRELLTAARDTALGAVPIIAGVGAASAHKAVQLAECAATVEVDALLVSTPYYTNASEKGVCRHIEEIATAVNLPIVLYNVPSRTGFNISLEAIVYLYRAGAIVGMKEAGSNLKRVPELLERTGSQFCLLSGDDYAAYDMRRYGGRGCVSVVANVVPQLCTRAHRLCDEGAYSQAETLFARLNPLQEALFLEPNPQGVKYALSRLGMCRNELRLPLLPVSLATEHVIDDAMQAVIH